MSKKQSEKQIECPVYATIRNCSGLPRWARRAALKSLKAQASKLGLGPSHGTIMDVPWDDTKEGAGVWDHLDDVVRLCKEFQAYKCPESWKPNRSSEKKAARAAVKKETKAPVNPTAEKKEKSMAKSKKSPATGVPGMLVIEVSGGNLMNLLGATTGRFVSSRPNIVQPRESAEDTPKNVRLAMAQGAQRGEILRLLGMPVPTLRRKFGKDDVAICQVIQDCERIPGVVRQKLIAAIIDLANSPQRASDVRLDRTAIQLPLAFRWEFSPFSFYNSEIWAAVHSAICGGPWRGHFDPWILQYTKTVTA